MKLSYMELRESLGSSGAELGPVIVITGEDLLRELAIEHTLDAILEGDRNAFNFEKFDGESSSGEHIAGSCNQLPMMGGRRVVLIKRSQKLLDKSEPLQAYLADPSPSTLVLLELSRSPDKRRKAWKEIEKRHTVVDCQAPKPAELEAWVVDRAKHQGLRFGRDQARYLVTEVGSDLRRLSNELEKLSLYASGDKLDIEAIASVLGRAKAQSIFKYVDALGAGRTTHALRQLGRLLEEGEAPLKILALIDRLVGQLRIAAEAQRRGGGRSKGGASLAQLLGVPPYAVKSLAQAATRFGRAELDDAVEAVASSDRILKSSALPARVVLESLTLRLCAPKKAGSARLERH